MGTVWYPRERILGTICWSWLGKLATDPFGLWKTANGSWHPQLLFCEHYYRTVLFSASNWMCPIFGTTVSQIHQTVNRLKKSMVARLQTSFCICWQHHLSFICLSQSQQWISFLALYIQSPRYSDMESYTCFSNSAVSAIFLSPSMLR